MGREIESFLPGQSSKVLITFQHMNPCYTENRKRINIMNPETKKLIDKENVIQKVTELFVFIDQRDWPKVRSCLAENVHFDMTSMAGGDPVNLTPEQITQAWDKGLSSLQAIHH